MKRNLFLFLPNLSNGGQERFVSRLSKILYNDYDIYIVLLNSSNICYNVSCPIIDLSSPYLGSHFLSQLFNLIKECFRLKRVIKKYKPIACISFGDIANVINILSRTGKTKVLTSIRGYASAEWITESRIKSFLLRFSDNIICVSKAIEKKIVDNIPKIKNKTSVLYNGYDSNEILSLSDGKSDFELDSSKFIISTAGTFKPLKGYWHLIKSIYTVAQKNPDVKLVIIGADSNSEEKKAKDLIVSMGIENNVIITGWQSNPFSIIQRSDLYVLSSIREGFPNALVEAMICGKPVIANDCLSGPREILSESDDITFKDGISLSDYGILVERFYDVPDYSTAITDDDIHLANAILLLMKNKSLADEYAVKAQKRAQEFTYERCRTDFIKIIESLK